MFILYTSSLRLSFFTPFFKITNNDLLQLFSSERTVASIQLPPVQLSENYYNMSTPKHTHTHTHSHTHIVRQLTYIIINRIFWGMYRLEDGEYSIVPCGHTAANRAWRYINGRVSQLFRTKPTCKPRKKILWPQRH